MNCIRCKNHLGEMVNIPREKFIFRPCAYAFIVKDDNVLAMKNKHSGKYWFPGGGVNIDERLEEGLVREIQEETRTNIKIINLLFAQELFFYYEPEDTGYHVFAFFFHCQPESSRVMQHNAELDPDLLEAEWISIQDIGPEQISDYSQNGDMAQIVCDYLKKLI
jgi:8-oxo-dGTP diphosphatase